MRCQTDGQARRNASAATEAEQFGMWRNRSFLPCSFRASFPRL